MKSFIQRNCLLMLGFMHITFLPLFAQNTQLDSLTQLLEAHPQADTTRVNRLNEVAMAQWNINPDKTGQLAKEALNLAQKIDFQIGMAASYHVMGVSYWTKGEYDKASEVAFNALRIYQQLQNRAGIAKCYTLLGLIYDEYRQFDKSIAYHEQALQQQQALDNQAGVATAANNLGAVYYKQNEYDKALEYFFKALKIRQALQDDRAIAESLSNIGGVFRGKKEYDQALLYIQQAIEVRQRIDDPVGAIPALQQMAGIYMGKNQYDLAETQYLKALALANELGIPKRQMEIYGTLSELKKAQGEYQQALSYRELYIEKRDSLQNREAAAHLAELDTKYQTERKEQQIALLQRDNRIKTLIRNILAVSVLVLIILSLILYQFFTYRSKKKQELLEAQQALAQQLQETNRLKSRFFANISHEFRTPLTLILDPIEELLALNNDARSQEYLHIMQRNARRLQQLINQFLDLSKLEANKMELRAAPSDFITFLRSLTMAFQSLAQHRGVKLEFLTQQDEVLLFFDADKLEKVFTNLISNALKFTPANGTVCIKIAQATLKGKPALEIQVQDSGIGIPPEHLPYIFDWFYQVNNVDNEAVEGTGIGLALAKELITLHQGQISVLSERGQGTTFMVLLPLGKAHLKEEDIVLISKPIYRREEPILLDDWETPRLSPGTPEAADKPTVLIVEDNHDLRLFITQALGDYYIVALANDGQAGLEQALTLVPDLIISDVMMPRMDGFTLCKHLKTDERTSHIPIILLTAKNTDEDRLQGLANLADDYLAKPFNTRELLARSKNLILSRKNLQKKFTSSNIILKPKEVEVPSVEQVFFEKLMQIIEKNIDNEDFGIEELSREMNMSRSQLHRKLVALTDQTPSQFVRSYRLQRALQLLQQNAGTIADIAFQVGFSNPAYFTKVFTEEFGYSPREWKQQKLN
ncbi:MAG: tetratricopeptide repeat protein [Saprospiraceae bacterium]